MRRALQCRAAGAVAFASLAWGCMVPSGNVGRPASPEAQRVVAFSTGQSTMRASYDNDPDTEQWDLQGLWPLASSAALRVGLVRNVDIGAELGLTHLGVNTRVAFFGDHDTVSLVLTADARHGTTERLAYDFTSRLLLFVPFPTTYTDEGAASRPLSGGSFLVGAGASTGTFWHLAIRPLNDVPHDLYIPYADDGPGHPDAVFESIFIREVRMHPLIGLEVWRQSKVTLMDHVFYVEPVFIVDQDTEDVPFDYRSRFGAILGYAATFSQLASSPGKSWLTQ